MQWHQTTITIARQVTITGLGYARGEHNLRAIDIRTSCALQHQTSQHRQAGRFAAQRKCPVDGVQLTLVQNQRPGGRIVGSVHR